MAAPLCAPRLHKAVYSVPGRLTTLHLTPLHKAATHASGLSKKDVGILFLCAKLLFTPWREYQ